MDNFIIQSQLIDENLNKQKITDIKKDYKNISLKYRAENINSSTVVSSDKQALSYIASRMGETSVIVDDVLNKLNKDIDLNKEVDCVLDLGSGTGSVLWALQNYVSKIKVVAVERQKSMIKYSKLLSKTLNLNIDYIQDDVLSDSIKNLENFDLVIESFMLNEMKENDRRETLNLMIDKSKKYLILIEPGTPNSYLNMMRDRDYLLSSGLKLVFPCPHSYKCALCNDYCNFTVRVNRTKTAKQIKGGTLNYEDEKYFYLVFAKQYENKKHNSVVIRKPVYRKSCVDLKLCKFDGTVKDVVVTKKDKINFSRAKKIKHGDAFDIES